MGMKTANKVATFFKYFVLILVGLIMIYPLLWMISATFKDNSEIFSGISLWIKHPTLDGYRSALDNFGGSINILQAMLNTYSYVLPKVFFTVLS
ncbi:MAG: carbohydrate ABC transporter permease, partial [Faecalibacterium prausnitzii]|nr:carbohydrate ABC transporter permease [Faecalibacterium prausnitzii]